MATGGDEVYWLALGQARLPVHFVVSFVQEFGSVEGLWDAPRKFLETRIGKNEIEKFEAYRSRTKLQPFVYLIDKLRREGVEVIPIVDSKYPKRLKTIGGQPPNTPPLVLLRQGTLQNFENCVAVVGTRRSSRFGEQMAFEIGERLARSGFTVVSGLAEGIDSMAHKGALEAKGRTIAVLPWLSPVYPKSNEGLFKAVISSGAAISERYHRPRDRAEHLFIERNRITSGISKALIIVESRPTGGTVWQFDLALEQGRSIYALHPPGYLSEAVHGFRFFIDRGAIPFNDVNELFNLLKSSGKDQYPKTSHS